MSTRIFDHGDNPEFGNLVTRDEVLFDVSMEPLKDHGYRSIGTTEFGIFANMDDGGEPYLLNTCSNRYELVPNSSIFPVIEAMLRANGFDFEANYYMDDYTVFTVEYIIKGMGIDAGNGDTIDPVFRIRHSYNGFVQYEMTFGFYRLVCTNGLVVPLAGQEAKNYRIKGKHTKKILQSIENLLTHLSKVMDDQPKFEKTVHTMSDRVVEKWEDRVLEVMNATGIKMGRVVNVHTGDNDNRNLLAINAVMNVELNDRQLHGEASDWLVYNAINEGYVYNNDLNTMKPHIREDFDQKVMSYILENPAE